MADAASITVRFNKLLMFSSLSWITVNGSSTPTRLAHYFNTKYVMEMKPNSRCFPFPNEVVCLALMDKLIGLNCSSNFDNPSANRLDWERQFFDETEPTVRDSFSDSLPFPRSLAPSDRWDDGVVGRRVRFGGEICSKRRCMRKCDQIHSQVNVELTWIDILSSRTVSWVSCSTVVV